jgi:hypothetical protein
LVRHALVCHDGFESCAASTTAKAVQQAQAKAVQQAKDAFLLFL